MSIASEVDQAITAELNNQAKNQELPGLDDDGTSEEMSMVIVRLPLPRDCDADTACSSRWTWRKRVAIVQRRSQVFICNMQQIGKRRNTPYELCD